MSESKGRHKCQKKILIMVGGGQKKRGCRRSVQGVSLSHMEESKCV